jgi:Concanavalin A-like lectin/glucanases superfamily
MNTLVLHHHYSLGSTFDLSNNSNHGVPTLVAAGSGAFDSSLMFAAADSRVAVAPPRRLGSPFAIATKVRFLLEPPQHARRCNLIEGFVSFALYVEANGALTGTIVDRSGAWVGATTSAGLVGPNAWHEAWLIHDGISQLQLQLDGVVVAERFDVHGPVRGVGDLGVAIGNWPDAGAYAFSGYIDEVKVCVYDPTKDLSAFMNPCCRDGAGLDAVVATLRKNLNAQTASKTLEHLLDLIAQAAASTRAVSIGWRGIGRSVVRSSGAFACWRRPR